jgi:hypothetical protein
VKKGSISNKLSFIWGGMYCGTIDIIMSSILMNFNSLMCSGNGGISILMALSEVLSSLH